MQINALVLHRAPQPFDEDVVEDPVELDGLHPGKKIGVASAHRGYSTPPRLNFGGLICRDADIIEHLPPRRCGLAGKSLGFQILLSLSQTP
jgi:hypothetical protein